ncbi:A/G-specific adenine glycosylase [Candidatus Dependentiae bacterium]|nr:A/G-specific adenine glycosylase [Candidatus Dependentiae bacterium]
MPNGLSIRSKKIPANNILLNAHQIASFQKTIWDYFNEQGRSFSWRQTKNPYHIVVSEVMLQQTQTFRVAPKYEQFILAFPDFQTLATTPFSEVLRFWKGLGYNRRALNLQKLALEVMHKFGGILPNNPEIVDEFPGIGPATASSICAFAFNEPTVFIETNIRAVYIHFFFQGRDNVHDNEIRPLVDLTLDKENPRLWYYALMDYGVMLKKTYPNPSRKSAHHTTQSKFEGSDRQIRGMILQALLESPKLSFDQLASILDRESSRIEKILYELCKEKLIENNSNLFSLPGRV